MEHMICMNHRERRFSQLSVWPLVQLGVWLKRSEEEAPVLSIKGATMTETNDSTQMLQQLVQTTDQAVATLEARAAAGTNLENQFADIQKKFDEAAKVADRNEREMRMRVLSA